MKPLDAASNLLGLDARDGRNAIGRWMRSRRLATLQTIVPEKRERRRDPIPSDGAERSVTSGVGHQGFDCQNGCQQTYYYEMPFDIQAERPFLRRVTSSRGGTASES